MTDRDTPNAQHPALDYALGQHIGKIEGRVAALEADRPRLTYLEQQVSEVRAEQAAARATREAQHAETMAGMASLFDSLAPLQTLPAMFKHLSERLADTDRRVHNAEELETQRTVSLRLPEPTPRNVLAALAGLGILVAIMMGGFSLPLPILGGAP